ncbi:photosystem II biogenesis protein Psp29 [Stanieria sp. NIES-3757]|nr:photosystem II biogenesis protein Psp29 [Stanieria sp. NIES-3757]
MNEIAVGNKTTDNIRTVSDAKRDFYQHHTRPINSVYRRVVEELLVEMHLLSVNVDFKSDPIYDLGVVTSFERLMQGYRPEQDKESIFNALCRAVGEDPERNRAQAGSVLNIAKNKSPQELVSWFSEPTPIDNNYDIIEPIKAIASNPHFKYSRLFAIGIYTLLEESDPEILKDVSQRNEILESIATQLHLPAEKMNKDLELYRGNLEKMEQLLSVIEDVLQAGRKQKNQPKQEPETAE